MAQVTHKAQIPSHAAPAAKTPKEPKAKKVRPPAPTVIPAWKDVKTGGVATTPRKRKDGTIKGTEVVRLKKDDFPPTTDGRKAFCDYMIAAWTWRKENWAARSAKDPAAKQERQLNALQAKLAKALCLQDSTMSEADALAKIAAILGKKQS